MSEHEWVQENLDAYIAGALPAQELARVAQHVADCADCKHALAQAQKLEATMAELFADARPDAKLEDRMIRGLRKVRVPTRWPAWLRFAVGAAAVVMLGVVGAIVQAVAGHAGPLGGLRMASSVRDERAAQSTKVDIINAGSVFKAKEPMNVTDMDAANVEVDAGIQYKNERISEVSVPGGRNPVEGRVAKDMLDIPEGHQAVGLPVDLTTTAHGLAALPGSRVNLILTERGKGPGSSSSRVLLQNVQVLAADARMSREGGGSGPASVVTLALSPKDALKASLAKEAGTLSISLRKLGDSGKDVGEAVSGEELLLSAKKAGPWSESYFKPGDGLALPLPTELSSVTKKLEANIAGQKIVQYEQPLPPPALAEPASVHEQPKQDPPAADSGLKIIRTGEMDFEVDSFDNAIQSIKKLIANVKGGFRLTGEGKKQPNGKMRGNIVVRMPPEHLDKFVDDVRAVLEKAGDLRMQRIGSQDVTKQYTDTDSELKAARTVEERLLAIIKNGKGDVKDLVAAEKELGLWRTKIEKMEGEIRYYSNQVALSTLTINLVEKEITAAASLVVNATVRMRIEVDIVSKAREAAEKAVEEFKGRIVKSDEKQHPAGQVEAIVHAEIPPANKDAFRKALEKLGIVSSHEDTQTQTTEGGTGPVLTPKRRVNNVLFQIALNNIVNVKPKHSVKLEVVSADVRGNFEKLKDEIVRVHRGQIRDAKLDESQDRQKTIATIDFSVPAEKKPDIDKLIAGFGPTLDRVNTQAAITEISTEQKFGYQLTLFSIATVEPREKVRLDIEVKDVERKSVEIAVLVKDAHGTITKPKSGLNKQGKTEAVLVINVPLAMSDRLVRDIKENADVLGWAQAPNPSAPENDLATAQIVVDLVGPSPIIPRDEGLGSYASKSLYISFTVFVYCVVTILAGIAFILPWAAVIYAGVWLMRRMSRKPAPVRAMAAEPTKPANP